MRRLSTLFLLLLSGPTLLWTNPAAAEETYMKAGNYIAAALGKKPEKPGILWITKDIKPIVTRILRRQRSPLRYRYYRRGNRTVWILNIIGKTLPITTGITIEGGKVIDVTVLTYRESHGSEIRFPAYSHQFINVGLTKKLFLSKPINGISGATLSSNAMKKIVRLALYLDSRVMKKNVAPKQEQPKK